MSFDAFLNAVDLVGDEHDVTPPCAELRLGQVIDRLGDDALDLVGLDDRKAADRDDRMPVVAATDANALSLADWPSGDGNCQVGIRLRSASFFGGFAYVVPGTEPKWFG